MELTLDGRPMEEETLPNTVRAILEITDSLDDGELISTKTVADRCGDHRDDRKPRHALCHQRPARAGERCGGRAVLLRQHRDYRGGKAEDRWWVRRGM